MFPMPLTPTLPKPAIAATTVRVSKFLRGTNPALFSDNFSELTSVEFNINVLFPTLKLLSLCVGESSSSWITKSTIFPFVLFSWVEEVGTSEAKSLETSSSKNLEKTKVTRNPKTEKINVKIKALRKMLIKFEWENKPNTNEIKKPKIAKVEIALTFRTFYPPIKITYIFYYIMLKNSNIILIIK